MTKHMKRLAAPRVLRIRRKEAKWSFRSAPGAHPLQRSVPLAIVVRDYLKLTQTGREAKRVIGAGDVEVDGRPRKEPTYAVGLMDVVAIPKLKVAYRISMDHLGRLVPMPIKADEAKWKLCRIEDKTTVPGGKTQLNLHDGRNILLAKNDHGTGDVLKIALPSQKVMGSFKLDKGVMAFVTGGAHAGQLAPVESVEVRRGPYPTEVRLRSGKDSIFQTVKEHVFAVGNKSSEIPIPEVSALVG